MKHHKHARGWRTENRMDVPIWLDLLMLFASYVICITLVSVVFVELSK